MIIGCGLIRHNHLRGLSLNLGIALGHDWNILRTLRHYILHATCIGIKLRSWRRRLLRSTLGCLQTLSNICMALHFLLSRLIVLLINLGFQLHGPLNFLL